MLLYFFCRCLGPGPRHWPGPPPLWGPGLGPRPKNVNWNMKQIWDDFENDLAPSCPHLYVGVWGWVCRANEKNNNKTKRLEGLSGILWLNLSGIGNKDKKDNRKQQRNTDKHNRMKKKQTTTGAILRDTGAESVGHRENRKEREETHMKHKKNK